MTPEQAKAHIEVQDRELGALEEEMRALAGQRPAALVFAMLEVLVVVMAGRPEFVTPTKIRIYRAVVQNLAGKGLR